MCKRIHRRKERWLWIEHWLRAFPHPKLPHGQVGLRERCKTTSTSLVMPCRWFSFFRICNHKCKIQIEMLDSLTETSKLKLPWGNKSTSSCEKHPLGMRTVTWTYNWRKLPRTRPLRLSPGIPARGASAKRHVSKSLNKFPAVWEVNPGKPKTQLRAEEMLPDFTVAVMTAWGSRPCYNLLCPPTRLHARTRDWGTAL